MTRTIFLNYLRRRLNSESYASIARSLGVTPAQVCHWTSGRRKPNKMVLILAELLDSQGYDVY